MLQKLFRDSHSIAGAQQSSLAAHPKEQSLLRPGGMGRILSSFLRAGGNIALLARRAGGGSEAPFKRGSFGGFKGLKEGEAEKEGPKSPRRGASKALKGGFQGFKGLKEL